MATTTIRRRSPFSQKDSPMKVFPWAQVIGAVAPTVIKGIGSLFGKKKKKNKNQQLLSQSTAQFDELFETYKESEFQPLDIDALRQENIYEELEVDTEAADYAREQFQEQQAGIMQGLRGMAGASGIAGLAQSLSGQAAKQARETQLTIGQQLQQNRKMQMQEQARFNAQQRQIQLANMEGARQFELDKMSTLIGVSGQKIAGARGAIAQRQQMYGQFAGAIGGVAGAFIGKS